jgi:short-chain Z-isoprenyl diphosphate synthase
MNQVSATGQIVTEESVRSLLYTAEMPDPDMIIRTGGEQRLSNFLPWQSVYSELFFTSTYWPAFTNTEFLSMLEDYAKRQRRHGT